MFNSVMSMSIHQPTNDMDTLDRGKIKVFNSVMSMSIHQPTKDMDTLDRGKIKVFKSVIPPTRGRQETPQISSNHIKLTVFFQSH